jgi:hypothetical protein
VRIGVRFRTLAATMLLAGVLANGFATGGVAARAVTRDVSSIGPELVGFGVATVTPSRGLLDGQAVHVSASGFGTATKLWAMECSRRAIQTTHHNRWCDRTSGDAVFASATNGAATFTFTIRTGGHFHALDPSAACGYNHDDGKCDIVVTDSYNLSKAQYIAYPTISFKDPRTVTTTSVTPARRTVAAGTVLALTARTTHPPGTATLNGTAVFADNGLVFASVKEPAIGKVTAKLRTPRIGKQRITVQYSGDWAYRPSIGRSIIVVR